jgi:thiol-disulfide isomerase/thioredoxin
MKNLKFIIPLLFIIAACSTKEQYKISGKIENATGKMLYFDKLGLSQSYPIDSVKLSKNGQFSFEGDRLNQPTFFLLKLKDAGVITLLVDSVEKVEVNADAKDFATGYIIRNSIGSGYIKMLNKSLDELKASIKKHIEEYNKTDKNNTKERQDILDKINAEIKDYKDFIGKFVMEIHGSFASYYALFQRWDDNTMVMNIMDKKDQVYFSTVATSLNRLYPESERVKHLYNYVLRAKREQRNNDNWKHLLETSKINKFPDIAQPDVNGDTIRLSSLKNKVIIVSFWASWDKASKGVNKQMKSIYKKYHKKGLEIYQVSLDRSKVLWENAIIKEDLPWINVSDLRYTESLPAKMYNVKRLPANFIIDKNGEIIGKDLFGQRLEEKMQKLLR